MAVIEHSILLKRKDKEGNTHILYPITTQENIDGSSNKRIVFSPDGKTITETTDKGKTVTTFNSDGTITEQSFDTKNNLLETKTTKFGYLQITEEVQ